MRLVALISGGKDSIFNMLQCVAARHKIVALANIEPHTQGEIDSYMYQSVGHEVITMIGSALCLPVYRYKTKGKAICKDKTYVVTENDEVEDLLNLLSKVKNELKIEGVSVGAIASDYQRTRVENVCLRLGLKCFAYLWKRDQIELLQEMINAKMEAIIVKVASIGLNPSKHLGMTLKEIQPILLELHKKYGMNVCGEGGEYETLTLNCPLFLRSISIISSENVILSNDAFAPVGFLKVTEAALSMKTSKENQSCSFQQTDSLKFILSIVRDPESFVDDCVNEVSKTVLYICFNNEMFPQRSGKIVTKELPFPFEEDDSSDHSLLRPSSAGGGYFKTDYKDPSAKYICSRSEHSLTYLATSNLNYSTGWCCIGNVTGGNLMDAMNNLKKNLERLNFNFEDVVIIYVYVNDISSFTDINAVYSHFVPETNPPARVCVGTVLPSGVNVLLKAVAQKIISRSLILKSSSTCGHITNKETLHVQSISHWVPAACGLYSHCVKVGEVYYLAGQIPLIPGSMEILNKPVLYQCKLTLRHILRVLQDMNNKNTFFNIFQAVCYVVSREIADDLYNLWTYLTDVNHATVTVVVVKALPLNAVLEWEVVACSYDDPIVDEEVKIMEDISVYIKRCLYERASVCSLMCKISLSQSSNSNQPSFPSVDLLTNVLVMCIDFLKKNFKESLPLCMFRVFYKCSLPGLPKLLEQSLENIKNVKIIITPIPVLSFENSKMLVTLCGMCT